MTMDIVLIYVPLVIGVLALSSLMFDIFFRVRYRATALTLERLAISFRYDEHFPWINNDQQMRLNLMSAVALFNVKINSADKLKSNENLRDLIKFFESVQPHYLADPRFVSLVREICILNLKGLFYRDIFSACKVTVIMLASAVYVVLSYIFSALKDLFIKHGSHSHQPAPSFFEITKCTLNKSNTLALAYC